MKPKLLLLTDYKGFFGSKQKGPIYRGGMNVPKLLELFICFGFDAKEMQISDIQTTEIIKEKPVVLYTSSEDLDNLYKSYIEDIVFHLQEAGVTVIPKFSHLRAHNNKAAMELLRMRSNYLPIQTIQSSIFGTLEELELNIKKLSLPVVIKTSAGAKSRGVAKADNARELINIVKHFSRSSQYKHDLKELLRKVKYDGAYVRESFYRKKFIVQNFIPGLSNDWKVLVYGNRCFVLYRGNRKNDFRASGSGKFEFKLEIPEGLLNYSFDICKFFNVPQISLDVGFDGKTFHLIEFQFLYFGTTSLENSPFHYKKENDQWTISKEKVELEQVYANSIIEYLENQ